MTAEKQVLCDLAAEEDALDALLKQPLLDSLKHLEAVRSCSCDLIITSSNIGCYSSNRTPQSMSQLSMSAPSKSSASRMRSTK